MKRIIEKIVNETLTSAEQPAKRRAPTLSDVAKVAGCAISVVSTVVNGAKGNVVVSEATRERVMAAAIKMGYRVNFASQSLVTRRTRSIGLYFPDAEWTGPGFSYDDAILRGVQAGCTANGYDLVLMTAPGEQRLEKCREYLMAGRIDGIVLAHIGRTGKWAEELLRMHLPVVAVDFSRPPAGLDAMVYDNEAAVQCALAHLWSLGHQRIGFIGTEREKKPLDAELREDAYIKAMAKAGMPHQPEWLISGPKVMGMDGQISPLYQSSADQAVERISSRNADAPTAWLAWGDFIAIHTLAGLGRAGVRVPETVSLIGIDDSETCRQVYPSLTSVRHPLSDMGRRAVEVLIARCDPGAAGGTTLPPGYHEIFAPTLCPRESTAAPAKGLVSVSTKLKTEPKKRTAHLAAATRGEPK